MGRDWYWSGRFSKRAGGSSGGGGGGGGGADREVSTSSLGCMSAVLHLFDFQQLHFPVQNSQPSFKPSSLTPRDLAIVSKGTEAPRNSLESDDGIATVSTAMNEEDNLKFPAGIQIKTNLRTKAKAGILSDETSCGSPGTKTPTLVARLMGLDLLPDAQSPSSPSSHSTLNSQVKSHPLRPRRHVLTKPRNSTDSEITSCRSLPETPRISLARRSEIDHRLSLQINKENNFGLREEFELSRLSFSRKKLEDQTHRSPSHYARQIVKQVKESVGRRVGIIDITNTVKTREHRRDELLLSHLKSKKASNRESNALLEECSPGKQSTSCSPRLKFIETKNKVRASSSSPETPTDQNSHTVKPSKGSTQPQSIKVVAIPKAPGLSEQQKQELKKLVRQVPQCRKAASEKFRSKVKKAPPQTSDVIRNKQEESFVRPLSTTRANMPDIRNKCKKSNPLSSNAGVLINLPTPLPVKKDPSPPATKLFQKQSSASLRDSDTEESNKQSSQLSSCSSQANKQEATQKPLINRERENDDRDRLNGAAFITGAHHCSAESQYVCDILSRTGIRRGTQVSLNNWFSPSHPLDPSIFSHLEERSSSSSTTSINACNNPLDYRCNRKLLFDAVDEVLVEILKQCIDIKPWVVTWSSTTTNPSQMRGSTLMEMLGTKLGSFPMSDCQYPEDIDELIELDLSKLREDVMAFEQEGERLVAEIEGDILDTLVHETMNCWWDIQAWDLQ